MTVHPDAQKFLDMVSGAPPLDTQSAEQNRIDLTGAIPLTGDPRPLHRVQDIEIANAQGIRSQFMYPLGFGIGVALAAVAGALMAPVFSVSPSIGATPLLKAFIVVILGGLGSIPGAALAALLLGVFESVANTFMSSSFSDMLLFGFVMLMLIFRPAGLLGKAGR